MARLVRNPAGSFSGDPPLGSRVAASGALAISLVTIAGLAAATAQNVLFVFGTLVIVALSISALWIAATNSRYRVVAVLAAPVFLGAELAILVVQGRHILTMLLGLLGVFVAWGLGTLALHWEVQQALRARWKTVAPTSRGVVIMNPKSGGGKVERFALAQEAYRRGVEAVLLEPGDDLRSLAESAVQHGADALGMAGGDGSQAIVAAVAKAHGLPFVCVPAGTRNHFALDLGIDRNHPARALDAFGEAKESSIDLGEVNGEIFVNNVSLGLYAKIVASDQYRNAKRRTVAEMLPGLIGPAASPSDFTTAGPDGPIDDAQIILVSNNPYRLASLSGFGSRPSLDSGRLGVVAITITRASDVHRIVALEVAGHPERYEKWRDWTTSELVVNGPPSLAVGIDGEAATLASPLHFTIHQAALRVRIAPGESGASPAFRRTPIGASTLSGLWRVVRGRPSGMVGAIHLPIETAP
ncbi:MAG: diacylglycerol kinase family protein [Acidimicrobiales bacterium]